MEQTRIPLSAIEPNRGQIEGLPANPRAIKDARLDQLKANLHRYPDFLEARPIMVTRHEAKYVAIGGNQRLRALREEGAADTAAIIIPEGTPISELRAYAVLDNSQFGSWDFDALSKDWDAEELSGWGIEIPDTADAEEALKQATEASGRPSVILTFTAAQFAEVAQGLARYDPDPGKAVLALIEGTTIEITEPPDLQR